ncbi:MAG: TonB-dependent receptor [Gammaproteobacteria bacterium]|nr:TonB-dependent receptor [Gammaproteobacteria bacterium]
MTDFYLSCEKLDLKRKALIPVLAAFLSVAPASSALSKEDKFLDMDTLSELSLEELLNVTVVIATGVKQTLARAPAVASVITARDIEAIGATSLEEVLETVPGLHVERSQLNYLPIYVIRGVHSAYNPEVLMLMNGIPINQVYLGFRGPMGANIQINAIARIEIIRGPGSAVFGADAFSGVINIITKRKKVEHGDGSYTGELDGLEAGVRAGSFDTQEAWVMHGGSWSGFDVALTLEYRTTEGQREQIEVDGQTYWDMIFGTNASLAPGPLNLGKRSFDARLDVTKGKWQLRAAHHGVRDGQPGVGNSQALDPTGRLFENRFTSDLTYHDPELTEHWDVTAQASYMDTKFGYTRNQTLYPPGAFGGTYPYGMIGNPGVAERHTRFSVSAFYSGFEKHRIRVGTGYHYADLHEATATGNFYGVDPATGNPSPPEIVVTATDTPYMFIPEKDRESWHLFVQDMWKFAPDWEFTGGLRFDEYSDFGTTLNPRLALVWQALPDLTLKALYGHAFRAPSFGELYALNNPVALGNPDLEPETIATRELAFNYQPAENLNFNMNLFSYKIRDTIRSMPDPDNVGSRIGQNTGSQKGYGAELEAKWRINRAFSVSGNYARQKSTDKESDQDAGYAPHHQVYVRGDWRFLPKWHFNAQANWVADRDRAAGDPRPEIDDYTTVDLTLRRKDLKNWNFAISVRNLFDEDAREPSPGPDTSGVINVPNDYPMAGRSYFAEISYHF